MNPLQSAMLDTFRADLAVALDRLAVALSRWQAKGEKFRSEFRWKQVRAEAWDAGILIAEYAPFGLTSRMLGLSPVQDTLVSAVIVFWGADGGEAGDEALRVAWGRVVA